MIWEFLKNFFSRKTQKMSDNQNTQRKHKLEIQIFEADYTDVPDGQAPKWRSVRMDRPVIIEVADEKEYADIRKQYEMCDQRIKVIREIDPFDSSVKQQEQVVQAPINTQVNDASSTPNTAVQLNNMPQPQVQANTVPVTLKPKIITVGDTQIKYDGEKVYSRQWVKLSSKESSYIRVVNDSNNKLVNLNGKHLEALRWVLIENDSTNDDIDSSIEAILND